MRMRLMIKINSNQTPAAESPIMTISKLTGDNILKKQPSALRLLITLIATLAIPSYALAREVTLTTELTDYDGDDAYIAIYLTNAEGVYKSTLWIAGEDDEYYPHLRDWARGSDIKPSEYDGLTGASVISGRTLEIAVDIDDSLIDSDLQIRVDTAVEDMRENRADIIAPLTTDNAGKVFNGRGYVKSFTYDF